MCPALAAAMLPGPQVWFLPPTSPTPSPASQGAIPLPFGVQLPWQPLEAPSNWPPHPRGPGVGGMWVPRQTEANTRWLISKLELASKYTRHSGAGTWTPRWCFAFKGLSRGPPKGLEQFFKLCLHFDMGPSRALSSVLILIGASSPWRGLCSYSIVGLSRALSCKLLFFSCN